MGKRKLEDSAAEQAVSKKPKRDKSKYTKNVDPNMTKAERKEARRVAKNKRKAERSKIRKEKLAEAAAAVPKEEQVKPAEVPADMGDDFIPLGVEEEKQPAGPNSKARRKAARKIEHEAEKAKKAEAKSARQQKAKAARSGQANGVSRATTAGDAEHDDEVAADSMDVTRDPISDESDSSDNMAERNDVSEAVAAQDTTPVADVVAVEQAEDAPPVKKQKKEKKEKAEKAEKKEKREKNEKKDKKDKKQKDGTATDAVIDTVTTNGHAESDHGSGYAENPALAGLPEAEVQSYLESKQITVKDAEQQLRPIMSFDYLPKMDKSSFKNFSAPTPIQAATWPYLLAGRDVIGVAETGSGKTLAFGVPCIYRLAALSKRKHIKACVVSPTRELALQNQDQLSKFGEPFGIKVACVYGGVPKDAQRQTLKGASIIVATPGRLNDFLQEGSIDLSHADYLVLDEADRMLDTGFEQEVRKIASSTAQEGRQTLMFTATWPQSVRDLAATFMSKPVRILIGETTGELRANTRIVQEVEVVEQHDKQQRLFQLLKQYQSGKNKSDRILVFCLYKKEATRIEEFIRFKGFNVAGIHGDLSQQKRTESLEAFKNGSVPLLVATDVAARGLDIPAVKLVINVTFPLTVEDYVHRIGRTGRAGQDGRAITLFTDAEKGLAGALINVLKAANQPVPEELLKFGTTVKKKGHDAYGAFYKDPTDMKKSTKITFD